MRRSSSPLLLEVFRETEVDTKALIEEYIDMYKSLDQEQDLSKRMAELRHTVEIVEKRNRSCSPSTPWGSSLTGTSLP